MKSYVEGFGLEWELHGHTQYDSYTKTNISATRLFKETGWNRELKGEHILEVGSGGGRFTEILASTGASITSIDYSTAVKINRKYNGAKKNVTILQADIYNLPVKKHHFDKVLCIGVLQHTPDPEKSFKEIVKYMKVGGELVIDIYADKGLKTRLNTKYWVRPITKRIPPTQLYVLCKTYVNTMWPVARIIHKIPKAGKIINWSLLIADYRGSYDLPEHLLKEWAILDTFDMLSPRYDKPQTIKTVWRWFREAGLKEVEVKYGYNGIEGKGRCTK